MNGVVDPAPQAHIARAENAGSQRTLIVHGTTDVLNLVIDDVSIAGTTSFLLIDGPPDARVAQAWSVSPEEFGVERVGAADLIVPARLTPEAVFMSVVDGTAPAAWIDLVAASAAAALVHAGGAIDLAEGFAAALEVLQRGDARAKLDRLRDLAS